MTRALKREVRDLIRSDAFNERILSEARNRAAELVREVFGEARGPAMISDAGAQSEDRSITAEEIPADTEFLDPNCADVPSGEPTVRPEEAPAGGTALNRDIEAVVESAAAGQLAASPTGTKTPLNLRPRDRTIGSTAICSSRTPQMLEENGLSPSSAALGMTLTRASA